MDTVSLPSFYTLQLPANHQQILHNTRLSPEMDECLCSSSILTTTQKHTNAHTPASVSKPQTLTWRDQLSNILRNVLGQALVLFLVDDTSNALVEWQIQEYILGPWLTFLRLLTCLSCLFWRKHFIVHATVLFLTRLIQPGQIPSKYLAYTTSSINTLVSVSVNEAAKHQGLPGENRHASSS